MAHLDDNARTGLHALGLGLLMVGVPVLVVQVVDLVQTMDAAADQQAFHIFRNGYLLPRDGAQFCVSGTTRMERIGLAALAAVLVGAFATIACYPLRRTVPHWTVGRWASGAALALLCWSALAWPVRSARLDMDLLVISVRPALFGELALPVVRKETHKLGHGAHWELSGPGEGHAKLSVLAPGDSVAIDVGTTRAGRDAVEDALARLRSAGATP